MQCSAGPPHLEARAVYYVGIGIGDLELSASCTGRTIRTPKSHRNSTDDSCGVPSMRFGWSIARRQREVCRIVLVI